jgi:G3E family GTPase
VTVDEPITVGAFGEWLNALVMLRGPNLLRIKGILNISNGKDPVLVHGVQHVFHPPVRLTKWPGDDRRSRVVVIARDMDENAVRESFTLFTSMHPFTPSPLEASEATGHMLHCSVQSGRG